MAVNPGSKNTKRRIPPSPKLPGYRDKENIMNKKVSVKDVRFTKNEDGTVRDSLLKVVWGKTLPDRMTWAKAKEVCEKLGKGWRLPTVNELFSLVDRTKYNPAIDKDMFPDTQSSYYWASETFAYYSDVAWYVYFYDGGVNANGKGISYYVRPVRASD